MFSSFLSLTSTILSLMGDFVLKIVSSANTYRCVFTCIFVAISLISLIGFVAKVRLKSAIAAFVLLGAFTFMYDFVGCNDCGSKLFLSHHFGSSCPAEQAESGSISSEQQSEEKGVCGDTPKDAAVQNSCK